MADRMDTEPVVTAAAESPHNGSRKRSLAEATTLPLSQQVEETGGRRETEENNNDDDDDTEEGAASPAYQRMTFYGEHRRYVTASMLLS
jgi:hypothetical protein